MYISSIVSCYFQNKPIAISNPIHVLYLCFLVYEQSCSKILDFVLKELKAGTKDVILINSIFSRTKEGHNLFGKKLKYIILITIHTKLQFRGATASRCKMSMALTYYCCMI